MANAFCTTGKKQLLDLLGAHTIKAALFSAAAALDAATAAYSTTNELATSGGYTQGGVTLAGFSSSTSGTTAFATWTDPTWATATFTGARYLLIYDSSDSNKAILVIDLGADRAGQGGDFTVDFPAFDVTNALIRI